MCRMSLLEMKTSMEALVEQMMPLFFSQDFQFAVLLHFRWCPASDTMSLFFIYHTVDGVREFVPMWSKAFQGFAKIDLSTNEFVVNAKNIKTLVRGLTKNETTELLDMGDITFAKSKSKGELQDVVIQKCDEIFTYFCGVMGTDEVSIARDTDDLNTPPDAKATGLVFLKKGRNMTVYWMKTAKGVGSVELGFPAGILPNITTTEALKAVVENFSKKTVEDMLSAYGRRVVCRGSETWMTSDKFHDYLKQNWDSILQLAKGTAMLRGQRALEPEEEDDPVNANATSSADQPVCVKLFIDISFTTHMPLEFVESLMDKFPMVVPICEESQNIFTIGNLKEYVAKKTSLTTAEFDIIDSRVFSDEEAVIELHECSTLRMLIKAPTLITVCVSRADGDKSDDLYLYFDINRATVGDVKVQICTEKGINMNDFVLKHGAKVMDTFRRLQEFMETKDDDIIKITFVGAGLSGGGARHRVIKTVLKDTSAGASPSLSQSDSQLFQSIIVGASSLPRATIADAKWEFASLDLSVLQQMEDYLKHSKATNNSKVIGVLDFIPAVANINKGMEKMAWAKETMTKLLSDYLQTVCADDANGVKSALVRKYVEGRIAIKKEQVSQQSAPPVVPPTAPSSGDVAMG